MLHFDFVEQEGVATVARERDLDLGEIVVRIVVGVLGELSDRPVVIARLCPQIHGGRSLPESTEDGHVS